MIKMYVVRLTGKQITLIVAALVKSKLPGSRELAVKLFVAAAKGVK